MLRHLYARRTSPLKACDSCGKQRQRRDQSLSGGTAKPTAGANAMIDRFLTGIVDAHSFLAKLWVLARPYWFTQDRSTIRLGGFVFSIKEAWIGRCVLLLNILLSVLLVYLSKLVNAWYAGFYNALHKKEAVVLWVVLRSLAVVSLPFYIAAVLRTAHTQLLSIRWRRSFSEVYFKDWLAYRAYYHMELTRQGADNPEQRIEQDCYNFSRQTLNL